MPRPAPKASTKLKQTFIVDPGPDLCREIKKEKGRSPIEIKAIKNAKTRTTQRFPPPLSEDPSRKTHFIGSHIGGVSFDELPNLAKKLKERAFALFIGSPHSWAPSNHSDETIEAFKENLKGCGILPEHILPHMPYLSNLGSLTAKLRMSSIGRLVSDINLCEKLGIKLYNIHPGSAKGYKDDKEYLQSLKNVADSINQIHIKTKDTAPGVKILIENTAGSGNVLGRSFEEIAYIINRVKNKERVGVCIDTQHSFASGYNLKEDFDEVMEKFGRIVGFKYLRAWHVNDSMTQCGSHVDRHAGIGKGLIGLEFFKKFVRSPWTQNMPLITETDVSGDKETKLLYSLQKDTSENMENDAEEEENKSEEEEGKEEEEEDKR